MNDRDPFEGFPKVGLPGQSQQPPVSQGFSSKGIEPIPGSLAYRFGQIPGSHVNSGNLKPIEVVNPEAYTPQLSSVSNPYYSELQQKHANALFQSRVQYHHSTYPPNVVPSSAPQSKFHHMFGKAKKYATKFWSQRPHQQQQQQQHKQQQQQQQRPHTNARQRAKMTRERALHIMRLPAGSNPANGVRKAFRKAALKYHPDKTTADRKEVAAAKANKYKKIQKAFKVLTNNDDDVDDTTDYDTDDDGGNMAKIGGNNTIKRRHKKHKLAKKTRGKTRGKKHSNRRSKTRKNTTKRR
jgi:hypothetical protein